MTSLDIISLSCTTTSLQITSHLTFNPRPQKQLVIYMSKQGKGHTLVVAETSRIMASKAAVSSACFWLCKAIFSLNLRGFAIMAESSDNPCCDSDDAEVFAHFNQ